MAQKLILPINKCKLTASYKNAPYKTKFGFTHFGIDLVSTAGSTTVYASGTGTVIAKGWDANAGYAVVIKYPAALDRITGTYKDVAFRYFHFNSINAKLPAVGGTVNKDTVIGQYGGSGLGSMTKWAAHLHLEADTDTKAPCYSPTFGGSGTVIKAGNDTTCYSALRFLHSLKADGQTFATAGDIYINAGDSTMPQY